MGTDELAPGVNTEIVFPDQVVDFDQIRLVQRVQDLVEVGVAGDNVDLSARPEYPGSFADPVPRKFLVALRRHIDVTIQDIIFVAVVMLVHIAAVDAVGGIRDDEVYAAAGDEITATDDAIAPEVSVAGDVLLTWFLTTLRCYFAGGGQSDSPHPKRWPG